MNAFNYSLIILAAGYSSRMKCLKALLPIGEISALERLISAGELAGCSEILVVTGYQASSLGHLIESREAYEIYNPDFDKGMFSSIQCGVGAVSDSSDGFFILPVDYPLVPAKLLEDLMITHLKMPDSFIVPTFMGKKGHPPLFPIAMKAQILESQAAGGLKAVTIKNEKRMKKMECRFEGAVMDMDHPEDYQEILSIYAKKQSPSRETCLELLREMKTPESVVAHSVAVGDLAYKISDALNQVGYTFDSDLLLSAGLLHDIARAEPKHWLVGAQILEKYGWDDLAHLTKNHMFYTSQKAVEDFGELDILCLSDKLFKGNTWADLELRKQNLLERFSDEKAMAAINERFQKAAKLKIYIENKINISLKDLPKQTLEWPDQPKKFLLIRHGQPRQHREKILLGQTDVDLSEKGMASARHTGQQLIGWKINRIYCSDLVRTKQTAEIIIERLNKEIDLIMIPAFREINLGKWDGCYIEEIKKKYPLAYQQRGENYLSYKTPGGENYYDLTYRVIKGLFKIINTGDEFVIVAHAGSIAVLKSFIQKRPLEETLKEKPAYAEVVKIESHLPLYWPGI